MKDNNPDIKKLVDAYVEKRLLDNFKTMGVEGTEMAIKNFYKGEAQENLLRCYNKLLRRQV